MISVDNLMSTAESKHPIATIDRLKQQMEAYLTPEQIQKVVDAHEFAEQAHEGQYRQTGDPYITHPLAVASILADMQLDHECLMAALLHDVIEDTEFAKKDLGREFGKVVEDIVDGVSKLKTEPVATRQETEAVNLRKMLRATGKDTRVVLVKLADRLHNMRTLQILDPKKRIRIAKETLEIYAPIALRLGMNRLKVELEDLGFRGKYPVRYERIGAAAESARASTEALIQKTGEKLRTALAEYEIPARLIIRQKPRFSIYEQMRKEKRSFRDIMDVQGFRILVGSKRDCYTALGAVHDSYAPVAASFSDYITASKENGYQSLHTTLLGEDGIQVEVHIRTEQMEDVASHGVTSKSLKGVSAATQWFKDQGERAELTDNYMEFSENLKDDLVLGSVHVHTHEGRTLALPAGATPVDLAYALGKKIGNTCVSCLVNRTLAPLSNPLQSGQRVKILTGIGAQPSIGWLTFVVTPRARDGIREALKHQRRSESTALGHRWLEESLKRHQASIASLPPQNLERMLKHEGLSDLDQLLEKIGLGHLLSPHVAAQLLDKHVQDGQTDDSPEPLTIGGTEKLAVVYAGCCKPIPGDPIVGRFQPSQGIEVHVENCEKILEDRRRHEEIVSLRWESSVRREFPAELRIEAAREPSALSTVADQIARENACLESIKTTQQDAQRLVINLIMQVRDRSHLAAVLRRIRHLKNVSRVARVGS